MTTISVFQKELELLRKNGKQNVVKVLNQYGALILEDFRKRSAVDTGRYKRNWRFVKAKATGSSFGISLKNVTYYASVLIPGVEPGGPPWYYPRRSSKTGRFVKGTGKLHTSFGVSVTGRQIGKRVWAGGLNPGKNLSKKGVMGGIVSNQKFQDKMVKDLIDAFLKDL